MKTFNVIELIFTFIITMVLLTKILFKYYNEKINNLKYKLDNSEDDYIDKMKEKHNIVIKLIELVENKYKINIKLFDEVKEMDINEISNINDSLLDKCYSEILQIKEDNQKTIGIMAQDALDINLGDFELVKNKEATGKDGDYMAIKESKLVYVAWKAIQEQEEIIEKQQQEIDELKDLVRQLLEVKK